MNIEGGKISGATPAELAEAFCNMDSEAQADFFAECERISLSWRPQARQERPQSMCMGAWWQWNQVGSECLKRGIDTPGARVLATLAAPLYAHTLRFKARLEQVND
jgi:hypothetical protein